jgi:hypothetical protein
MIRLGPSVTFAGRVDEPLEHALPIAIVAERPLPGRPKEIVSGRSQWHMRAVRVLLVNGADLVNKDAREDTA